MGEYATRIKDGAEIKIGTCESLYYLRYDQRNQVRYNFGLGSDKWYWRIPMPSEDDRQAGDFEPSLLTKEGYIPAFLRINEDSNNPLLQAFGESEGKMQTRVEQLGMLVNIPCYHGIKLPESANGVKFFWNGKRNPLYLAFLANYPSEMRVGFRCSACGAMFSAPFNEALPLIKSLWMRLRLLRVCAEYWQERNEEPCTYSVSYKGYELYSLSSGVWHLAYGDEILVSGDWQTCRNKFLSLQSVPEIGDEKAWIDASERGEWEELYELHQMRQRYL